MGGGGRGSGCEIVIWDNVSGNKAGHSTYRVELLIIEMSSPAGSG